MDRIRSILIALLTGAIVASVLAWKANPGGVSFRGVAIWITLALGAIILVGLAMRRGGLRFGGGKHASAPSAHESAGAALGFSYQAKGETAFRRSFSDLPGIPDSGKTRHLMRGRIVDRDAVIFEHMYMVYNGSTMVPVHHTVFSTSAPDWPRLRITPRSCWSRLARRFGWESGLQLENAEFNMRFVVRADDEDFALTLLAPEMQHMLCDKLGVTWHLRPGRMSLVYSGPLRADRMEQSLQRVATFWSLVPPELAEWGPPARP